MVTLAELLDDVDRAFAGTARGMTSWPDPHVDRRPSDDEYSRVTDGARWRIVGARFDAWLEVLDARGLARIERHALVDWVEPPRTQVSRSDRAVPRRAGALALVVARSRVGDVDDAGVTFGVGDPATLVGWLPQCGCDACDSGSQDELDQVDAFVGGVVAGTFRRLSSGGRVITQLDPSGWSASGDFERREPEAVLAEPDGWDELSGAAWWPEA